MNSISAWVLAIFVAISVLSARALAAPATGPQAANDASEAAYTQAIEKRTEDILAILKLEDATQRGKVHDVIMAQYRALRDWHDANDEALKKAPADKQQAIKASLKELHDQFIGKLSQELTPAQVDQVKDKMTYGVVQVTYNGYCEMIPTLTDAQKAKIMQLLVEARELAMDGGSSKEKHDVFGKYKGKINIYLSKEGYDLKKANVDWAERRKAATRPAATRTSE